MRIGRVIEDLQRRLADARAECDQLRAVGPQDAFLQAYVTVKSLELQLEESLRQPRR